MTFFQSHILSVILFTPLAGALILLFIGREKQNLIRWIANATALVGFLVSVPLWFRYDPPGSTWQFVERMPWIPSIGADFGKAANQAAILRERAFPTAMVLPLSFPATPAGLGPSGPETAAR